MRVIFSRVARYLALLRGHSDFAHSSAGAYPLFRGPYQYGYPFAPYGGGLSKVPASGTAAAGAAAAAADATELVMKLHSVSASAGGHAKTALQRLYISLIAATLMTWASAVASASDTLANLASSAPRTLRTVMWAIRAGLSYKRFQASCLGADTEADESYQAALAQLHTFWAERLLQVCRRNGGVYVKAGQFAAAFGGVPREYRTVLAQLEDRAVPQPYKQVRRALERELGGAARVDELFKSFNPRATAAASLAQVHHAVLASGEEVAVKVQYPGLAGSVASDLSTMRVLCKCAQLFFSRIQLAWLYEELEKKLEVELDFKNELDNSRRFAAVLAECESAGGRVAVPRMHAELCSSKLLVMEWIAGCKITDVEALQRQGINPHAVGRQLVKLFGELMFLKGFVHGDPHPGNLMVRPRGRSSWLRWLLRGSRRGFEVVVLDHGTYLDVEPELRQQFCQLWCAVIMRDEATQTEISADMAGERGGKILPLLLTQRARNKQEERELAKRLGIRGFGDMTSLLAAVSRPLVDMLRISTVIRASSAALGITMAERLQMYSQVAVKGLPPRGANKDDYLHKAFASGTYRFQLHALLLGLGLWSWSSAVVGRTWETLLGVFGEALFE